MEDKLFLIFFDKGVLAVLLLIIGYFFNHMLQVNKLKGDTVTELAKDTLASRENGKREHSKMQRSL